MQGWIVVHQIRQRARPKVASDRDERIFRAARALFAARGFDDTAISDVATAAGVAVGTVYLRHATKADLLRDVLERVAGDFVAVMSAPDIHDRPWPDRLAPLFTALIVEAARQPDLAALMSLSRYLPPPSSDNLIKTWIAEFITRGQDAGAFRRLSAPRAAALAFGMVEGGMSHMMISGDNPHEIAAMLADAAERWMLVASR